MDPSELRTAARNHRVSGLVAELIDETARPALVAGLRADAHRLALTTAVVHLEAARIGAQKGSLAAPILLKGASVARWYPDPQLRPSSDIDLLVPMRDLDRWVDALTAIGYERPATWDLSCARRGFTHELKLRRRAGDAVLLCELHPFVCLAPGIAAVAWDALRPHAVPGPIDGLLSLDAAAQVVVLALHLAHHDVSDRRLIWYRDFGMLGDALPEARHLAQRLGVGAVVDDVLAHLPAWVGVESFAPERAPPRVAAVQPSSIRYHTEVARALGPAMGVRYLLSRGDPRRFMRDGRLDATAVSRFVTGIRARRRTRRT